MIPTIIVDGFFPNPDKICEFALQQNFFPSTKEEGRWPGKRTEQLWKINQKLFNYTANKIIKLTHLSSSEHFKMHMHFQLISPYSKEKYNKKNCGWIHKDNLLFGGIIYLNPISEKDTGTSIYQERYGFSSTEDENLIKTKLYLGEDISDEEYNNHFDKMNNQYEETIKVNNVYNRLVMFSGNTYHGVQTFGEFQDRLTLVFFCDECLFGTAPVCL